jgi:hypothetical protein
VGDRLDIEGGLYGERPDIGRPVANRADDAWQLLEQRRAEARALGIEVEDAWPLNRVEEEIADAS